MNNVDVYDVTLRDGTQGEGISFSVEDKIRVAHKIDELGIKYIEGGSVSYTHLTLPTKRIV